MEIKHLGVCSPFDLRLASDEGCPLFSLPFHGLIDGHMTRRKAEKIKRSFMYACDGRLSQQLSDNVQDTLARLNHKEMDG